MDFKRALNSNSLEEQRWNSFPEVCPALNEFYIYLTIILRGRAGYEMIYNQRGA